MEKQEPKIIRPSWDEYFMQVAMLVATRSTCLRHHVGAVFVKDKRIITTGYNGAVSDRAHCLDVGCMRIKQDIPSGKMHEKCEAVHAEQNGIIQAAIIGISLKGAILYCTHSPCIICAKMIRQVKISQVYYYCSYPDKESKEYLAEANISLIQMEKPSTTIITLD